MKQELSRHCLSAVVRNAYHASEMPVLILISQLLEFYQTFFLKSFGPRQAKLVLIAFVSSEGSGEPAYLRSLARTSAARS